MLKYEHLQGIPFNYGTTDCYGLVRSFYQDNFDIELTNYARIEDWWDKGLNLFMDYFHTEGFVPVDDHPSEWRPGDLILMSILSPVANHSAILLPEGKILHHMYGQLSKIDYYKGSYRNHTVAVLRHKSVNIDNVQESVDLMELLPHEFRSKIEAQRAS